MSKNLFKDFKKIEVVIKPPNRNAIGILNEFKKWPEMLPRDKRIIVISKNCKLYEFLIFQLSRELWWILIRITYKKTNIHYNLLEKENT